MNAEKLTLIADSGSSKTDWRLIDSLGAIKQFRSKGLNPYFNSVEMVKQTVLSTFDSLELADIGNVHFYGAGCSTDEKNKIIETALSSVFVNAEIFVEHDLLAAARASCGREKGIAVILGTGSNCCLYDGAKIIKSYPSGGYLLGDEGGGFHLGKQLLKAFIEERLPSELRERFIKRYGISSSELLHQLYQEDFPNRYMASFSPFIFHHRQHSFMAKLIANVFRDFFDRHLVRFEECKTLPINFVGSVAYYYQEFINEQIRHFGFQQGRVIEKPISALCLYHQDLS